MTFDFYAFVAAAEQRKSSLGIAGSLIATDALRNKGGQRTAGKRKLLARMKQRAIDAGCEAVRAYY
jgi:hypothetical protein